LTLPAHLWKRNAVCPGLAGECLTCCVPSLILLPVRQWHQRRVDAPPRQTLER
jgi:hypothetical protein